MQCRQNEKCPSGTEGHFFCLGKSAKSNGDQGNGAAELIAAADSENILFSLPGLVDSARDYLGTQQFNAAISQVPEWWSARIGN